ncbi:MAG TPA: helix-turn-helix domain-containing protein [Candidatus Lachnoclostridium stercorigallinarum]|uniref:Helix-turn-helix domain-containing protein n=1 Tax=Candidatus Lachnoclostridium stercorigallinarum TaxID=2838634 RepID=A0A9D2GGT1_9FIRM|nr:helix-turn-helix domain-containing protein [Candidatus Lachnoclostridium stercorigallinarum]
MIDYTPLWLTMEQKGVTQYQLLRDGVLENKTLDSLKKNKNITVLTMERLCRYLDCTPNDIIRFL